MDELRANPNKESIQKIVDYIAGCNCEYYNVRRAVEKVFDRPFTEEEKALVARLQ